MSSVKVRWTVWVCDKFGMDSDQSLRGLRVHGAEVTSGWWYVVMKRVMSGFLLRPMVVVSCGRLLLILGVPSELVHGELR